MTKLILAFISIIIGVVLIGSVSTESQARTTTAGIVDESISIATARLVANNINTTKEFTITNAPTGWKVNDCPITNFVLTNASGTTLSGNYTFTAASGKFTVANNTFMVTGGGGNNGTLADYNYCADSYMNLSWGRTVINLVPGFFALAILFVGLMLFYSVAKDYGII